jgi:DNA modification methylase
LREIASVDTIATDPPYGIEDQVGGYGRGGRTIANDKTLDVCHEGLRLAADKVGCGYIAAFYSPRVTPAWHAEATLDAIHAGELCWDKKAPGMGAGLRYQHESIALFRRGDAPDLGPIFSVLPYYRVGEVHPHEKPVPLMKRLLIALGGSSVLDPFMGSGSTGVAAVELGRTFVGIELDDAYFDLACQRIEAAQKQTSIFTSPPPSPPEQVSLG